MGHLAVDHETIGPVFSEMRTHHVGPVVISQDLTVFNIANDAVVARQATVDPFAWPVVGQSQQTGPPMSAPHDPPAWWGDALMTD
jgi:ribonuclease Z